MTDTHAKTNIVTEGSDLYRRGLWMAERNADFPKPMRQFLQLDAWVNRERGDSVMVPDEEGDVLMGAYPIEPQRSGTTVRVLIDPTASPADVLRVMHKLAAWYESDHADLLNPRDTP